MSTHLGTKPAQAPAESLDVLSRSEDLARGPGPTEAAPRNGHDPGVFSHELLDALVRFRDGDFSVRLGSGFTGTDGKIADLFNQILAVSARRSHEVSRVCRAVGQEGKLKQRIHVPGAVGGWSDEVVSLNTLIDDLAWPTTEVTRAIGAVAKGDLTQAMALEVDGRALEGEFLRSA